MTPPLRAGLRASFWLLLQLLLAARANALEVLRLPWIFSDRPELSADFSFSPSAQGKTLVEFSLGGRFSKFGLPWGAARAPVLDVDCEFVSPGELVKSVARLKARVDLRQVLLDYGLDFSRERFASGSPLVYKTEFKVALAPGDYNVVVSLSDKELSISSRRTLHVIVPALEASQGLGDLKFCLGLGEALDAKGRKTRVLDPNPWRQVGGNSGWDLIVAYDAFAPASRPGMLRSHGIWKLRGGDGKPLWAESGPPPARRQGQLFTAQPPPSVTTKLKRGVYLFKVRFWRASDPRVFFESSKTFEALP